MSDHVKPRLQIQAIKWADPSPKLKVLVEDFQCRVWLERLSTKAFCILVSAIFTVTFGLVTFAASEEQDTVISKQMLKCPTLPPNAPDSYSVSAVAILKDGAADLVLVNFPAGPSEWEMVPAPIVADAVTRCGPYQSMSGRFKFSVTRELMDEKR